MKKLVFFGCVLFAITACSNNDVRFAEVIQNQSAYPIWVKIYDTGDTTNIITFAQDSILVPANDEVELFSRGSVGTVMQFSPCKIYADSLGTRVDSPGKFVVKNLNDTLNYQFNDLGSSKKEGKKCECRLVIAASDVQ